MLARDTTQALFVIEILGVLAIPGPTNSLLLVSGVSRGFQKLMRVRSCNQTSPAAATPYRHSEASFVNRHSSIDNEK